MRCQFAEPHARAAVPSRYGTAAAVCRIKNKRACIHCGCTLFYS
ncbi:hypothetical protein DESPIG_00499 [Desulfovibrio piger ATCC 29098]|uniref:Uncharacterized protein n=1 Tax=Desulfovibrio piger ATCC 29098 TaxID=411464 RepID=B6WR19_9BACT|nr:hypothetical protein DESPIG_00499 [Desulfovibrio piger ATCC 29098]